jgi:hypothetical protein
MTKQTFINKASIKHNNKYTYDHLVYVDSKSKVVITCPIHGDFQQTPGNHLYGQGCPGCRISKSKETNLAKYGTKHPMQSKIVMDKTIQTNLEKYGVEHPAQNSTIKDKAIATNIERYGVTCTQLHPEIRYKTVQTNLEKYGVKWVTQDLTRNTKAIKVMLDQYGVSNPSHLVAVREKAKQTTLDRFGTSNYNQKHLINILPLINNHDWLFDQYITLNKTAQMIADELDIGQTTVCRYLKQNEIAIRVSTGYSIKSIEWLNSFENINIQHALNGGEYKIPSTKYKADGYDPTTNTIYEFYGDVFHGNLTVFNPDDQCHPFSTQTALQLNIKTILREDAIKSLGYNIVSIWERDWDED